MSVTFDPFMYLSLPLILNPTFSIKVFSSVGTIAPTTYTVTISKQGRYKDLLLALTEVCKLQAHERLVLLEVCCKFLSIYVHFSCLYKVFSTRLWLCVGIILLIWKQCTFSCCDFWYNLKIAICTVLLSFVHSKSHIN